MSKKMLLEYKNKRNFNKTTEPKPILKPKSKACLSFVVQHHIARRDHFDFRLEWNGVLLSWAIPKGPSYNPRDKRLAIKVEDHPFEYRNFEGVIPKGEYGAGVVMLWDEGEWQPLSDVESGLKKGVLKFRLIGFRLKGGWAIVRLKSENENNWILIKEKDEFSKNYDGISNFITSVRTGLTMFDIENYKNKKNFNKKAKFEKDIKEESIKNDKKDDKIIDKKNDNKFKEQNTKKNNKNNEKFIANAIKNPFKKVDIQLVKSVVDIPTEKDWIYEIKYDGYRIIAFIENGDVKLITRNHKNYTKYFKKIESSLSIWSKHRAMVLDGEICITDSEGKTDFQLLQNHMKKLEFEPTYIVFDLLALNGKDLRNEPLFKRKEILKNLMKNSPKNLCYSEHIEGNGKEVFFAVCELKMEGIVGKKITSTYCGARNGNWIKLKCRPNQEFVIGGYTKTVKRISGVSSLLLGFYRKNELIYAGRSGTGMTEKMSNYLEITFQKISQKKCPFKTLPKIKKDEQTFFIKPIMVAEIQFVGWTNENLLRQASFKGIRTDKDAKDVFCEIENVSFNKDFFENKNKISQETLKKKLQNKSAENIESGVSSLKDVKNLNVIESLKMENLENSNKIVENSKNLNTEKNASKLIENKSFFIEKQSKDGSIYYGDIKISSPNKIMYATSKIRKIDIVRYYIKVANRMLPFLKKRPISVVRCPKGIENLCFFKKHPTNIKNGIVPIKVENSKRKKIEYYYIENLNGLIFEAQMCSLEFHTWGCCAENLEKPDIMVFDLDPYEKLDLKNVQRGVLDLKSILDELSLVSFLKTSGGKGYHLVLPFKPSASWEVFYNFSKKVAEVMAQKWPDCYTDNIRKNNRKNKIFIDWVRNGKGATSIAPYSLRARKNATVSMPIFWEELFEIAPNGIDIKKALLRLDRPDPWENFFKIQQKLKL